MAIEKLLVWVNVHCAVHITHSSLANSAAFLRRRQISRILNRNSHSPYALAGRPNVKRNASNEFVSLDAPIYSSVSFVLLILLHHTQTQSHTVVSVCSDSTTLTSTIALLRKTSCSGMQIALLQNWILHNISLADAFFFSFCLLFASTNVTRSAKMRNIWLLLLSSSSSRNVISMRAFAVLFAHGFSGSKYRSSNVFNYVAADVSHEDWTIKRMIFF